MSVNQKNIPLNSPAQSSFIDEEDIDLAEYLGVLLAYKWLIGIVTMIGLFLGGSYAFLATPVYQANALIQVEDSKGSGLGALEDVSSLLEGGDAAVEAEIQLLYSRMVIKSAVDQLSMNTIAEPDYFPLIGHAAARYFAADAGSIASPWLGLSQYAWGGEQIAVDFFDVPESLLGEPLQIITGSSGQYHLINEDGQLLLKGQVGKLAEAPWSGGEQIKLLLSLVHARPETHFNLIQQTPIGSVETVLKNFSVKEKGKKSGMLSLSMSGEDKASATQLLNKIADVYVRQNISRNAAEAGLSLSFLERQLPALKERVDAAENAYNHYRTQHGSADLATETVSVLQGIVEIEAAILELQQERGELRKRYKEAHPVIQSLDEKIALLKAQGEKYEESANQLPETQRDILRLRRDVEVNTALYTKLLNTSQELKVVEAGTVGNVRIIDYALIPEKPIKPKKAMVLAIALVVSLFLGVVLAFMLRALRGGVNDPDEVEQKLGLPVYASILHSNIQQKKMKRAKKGTEAIGILAAEDPDDSAVESFRSLRTTLHFTLKQAENNIIMVTGASPGVGKSFVSMNLAAVLANNEKTVLVIDCDLRKGYLNRYIGIDRTPGLSELIAGETDGTEVHTTGVDGLYLLPTGTLPPNPAELLLHKSFRENLDKLSHKYDYVIIDGPPILAVTDPAIIGVHAATTLLVIKENHHPIRELEQATRQLQQAGVEVKGAIFNDVAINQGRYGYGKYIYQYDYKST